MYIGVITLTICYYIYNHFSFILDRFLFAFHQKDMGWMALLSGRDSFFIENMTVFYNSNFISNILGLGMPNKTIEIDLFDFLYISGYIGVFLLFILWIINIKRSIKNNEISSLILFTNFLLIGISFVAGHIYSSAMAGAFIAIINILPMINKQFTNTVLGNYK